MCIISQCTELFCYRYLKLLILYITNYNDTRVFISLCTSINKFSAEQLIFFILTTYKMKSVLHEKRNTNFTIMKSKINLLRKLKTYF